MQVTTRIYRWLVIAATAIALLPANCDITSAQEGRDRPRRDGRENGRPDGEGRRGRERRGDRENSRPEESRPAAPAPTATPAASTANSFGTTSSTTSESDKVRKWASGIVAKNDKDGNKILEGDELSRMGQSGREADQNGDGKITGDELYQYSVSKSSPSSSATTTASSPPAAAVKPKGDSSPGGELKRTIVNDKRKSYRFKSTKERINNWKFSSRDADGDGQVSMSEFTRSWNDRTAAEFLRYDKDNDGMITVDEAK